MTFVLNFNVESRCEVFREILLEKLHLPFFVLTHSNVAFFRKCVCAIRWVNQDQKTCEHEQYTDVFDINGVFFLFNTMHTSWKCQTKSKVTGVDPSGRNYSCMFNLSFRISFFFLEINLLGI